MFASIFKHKLLDSDLKMVDIANIIGTSQPNLSQKIKRDNFSEKEMIEIANALNCDLEITLKSKKETSLNNA